MKKLKLLACGAAIAAMIACVSGCTFTIGGKTSYSYKNSDDYVVGDREISDKVDSIDVDYISGEVKIVTADTDVITIKETAKKTLNDKTKVHTWVDGSTLRIKYCESNKNINLSNLDKKLEITIPKDLKLDNLKFDMASGDVDVTCEAKEVDMDTASGEIKLNLTGDSEKITIGSASGNVKIDAKNIENFSVSTASGDVVLNADSVKEFDSDTASGSCECHFKNVPEKMDMDSASGDAKVYLPKDADATVDFDTASGDFSCDQSFEKKDDKYVLGKGTNKIVMNSASGDLKIVEE